MSHPLRPPVYRTNSIRPRDANLLIAGNAGKLFLRSPSQVIESNFSFSRSSIISSPVLPAAFLELLAAAARARVVTPKVLKHLLLFGFRRSLLSRLNHGSDFFTEPLRQFFKCWTIEERRTFGWIVIPPLGNPPVGVLGDLVF